MRPRDPNALSTDIRADLLDDLKNPEVAKTATFFDAYVERIDKYIDAWCKYARMLIAGEVKNVINPPALGKKVARELKQLAGLRARVLVLKAQRKK